jgi:carboxyl-terminal processing protease
VRRFAWPLLPVLLATLACGTLARSAPIPPPTDTPGTRPSPSPVSTTQVEAPAYVPPECQNIPMATLAPSGVGPGVTPSRNSPLDAEQQGRTLDGLVNAVREHYVYPDAVDEAWLARASDLRAQAQAGIDTETFYAAVQPLISALGDEHSYFQTPQQIAAEQTTIQGTYNLVGIGAFLGPIEGKATATVLGVLDGGPAWHAGLQPHDVLLAVDGGPIRDPSGASRTLGPECSAVVLTIQTPGGAPRDLTLVRSKVSSGLPLYPQLVPTGDGSRIGYVFLPTFLDEAIPGQVKDALQGFGPLDGLILDDRMNGGGLGSVASAVLGYFVSGRLGEYDSRDGAQPFDVRADPVENSLDVPLIVLIGKDTVSYGEIFAGVLQDVGRAKLIGETTLGNVEQLRSYDLEDGSRVWLASARFVPVNSHADWEQKGIIPDVQVVAAWDTFTFATDPGIAAALRLLGH